MHCCPLKLTRPVHRVPGRVVSTVCKDPNDSKAGRSVPERRRGNRLLGFATTRWCSGGQRSGLSLCPPRLRPPRLGPPRLGLPRLKPIPPDSAKAKR
jgi:hypothetical protein